MARMDRTTEYAKLVLSGKRICGRSERLAAERHINDMKNKSSEWIFDVSEAERHIDIANTLTIGEGEAHALKTRGFQNFIIGSLFGWRRKRSDIRRFREAYVQVGRQNGKSFLAGALANDFATFGGYQYGRIFCTATKQDQANIVWDEVRKFIESDKDLAELYKIKTYDKTITSRVTGTTIKAIGRDTKSADGFRTILAIVDEYHAHPTNQMYKLMMDGQDMVKNALTIAITTSGFNLKSPCYEQYQFCKKVLEGVVQKD
ncbi:MAG: terminase large subunit, partial [Selenomonas sp.]|nr:terminase large subunit [Selenomonas sp.]